MDDTNLAFIVRHDSIRETLDEREKDKEKGGNGKDVSTAIEDAANDGGEEAEMDAFTISSLNHAEGEERQRDGQYERECIMEESNTHLERSLQVDGGMS
jgi:hypothetical protein